MEAGFDGIELWEYHASKTSEAEQQRLKDSPLPIRIFNSYATLDTPLNAQQLSAARWAQQLAAKQIKFNIGNDPHKFDTYVENVAQWAKHLPSTVQLLCECHPGTLVETPVEAGRAFTRWSQVGVEAIIHPFNLQPDQLVQWFQHIGPHITHAHVQTHRKGRMQSLAYDMKLVKENVNIMQHEGFRGSFSIEFTIGVGQREEQIHTLFQNAVDDLVLLRELLAAVS